LVLLPLGLDGEPLGVELPLGGVVLDGGIGAVADGGDAEGDRSPGRSPTRSERDSLQAVSMPTPSASAQRPVSILFIERASSCGVADWVERLQRTCRWWCLDTLGSNYYQCGHQKEMPMKLEGAYEVPAPRDKVWDAFLDPKLLKQAIPGCEKLEATGPDEYKATMKIGVGGVKGTFEGKVKLGDKKERESYRMAVEGSGGPGFIRGDTVISLTDSNGGTRVSYSADVQVGGLIASVGQRLLGGVSKMMADKFFTRMGELLQA
jgi:carbon monoxide dehydrogenase subunit G